MYVCVFVSLRDRQKVTRKDIEHERTPVGDTFPPRATTSYSQSYNRGKRMRQNIISYLRSVAPTTALLFKESQVG